MIVIVGLVILIAALIIGVAGVLANSGDSHAMSGKFAVFGYHVTGSTGELFLSGIVIGALALAGLSLLLAGYRRTARRANIARRELKNARAETAAAGAPSAGRTRARWFARRPEPRSATATAPAASTATESGAPAETGPAK